MSARIVSTIVALSLAVTTANAQPVQKQLAATSTLQVLDTKTLPGEDATVQAVLGRLRAKLGGDATFATRLDAALAKRDLATAGSLLGAAAQLQRNSIVYGGPSKTGALDGRRGLVRFASYDPDAAFNPWYLIFSVNGRVYCASTSAATCHDALHKMGYANTTQIW